MTFHFQDPTLSDTDKDFIAAFFEKLRNGTCPHCDLKIERQRQVGRCVYAEPCGHRLYQGRVGAFTKRP